MSLNSLKRVIKLLKSLEPYESALSARAVALGPVEQEQASSAEPENLREIKALGFFWSELYSFLPQESPLVQQFDLQCQRTLWKLPQCTQSMLELARLASELIDAHEVKETPWLMERLDFVKRLTFELYGDVSRLKG